MMRSPMIMTGVEPDPSAIAALEFLERSRDVANEAVRTAAAGTVVDGTRIETSTSGREEVSAPRSGSTV